MQERQLIKRVRDQGVRAASVIDLLAVAFSRREADVALGENMARDLLSRFGSLHAICDAGFDELSAITGQEEFEALRAMALLEIGRRSGGSTRGQVDKVESPEDVWDLLQHLRGEKREHFVAILLNAKSEVMRVAEIHIGTLTASIVGPREIFREAIRDGACSIVVAHNHPSGDPTPSPEDISVTSNLKQLGEMLDIPVLDHIIIGERYAVSLNNGAEIGRQMGRNRQRLARESTGYARSEGTGPRTLP